MFSSTPVPGIEAIALVGARNQRLYLNGRLAAQYQRQKASAKVDQETLGGQLNRVRNEMLRLEYAAHCALDVVDERTAGRTGAAGEVTAAQVSYLGLVLNLEGLAVYAMVTSTRLRILLLIQAGEAKVRDLDCITVLRAIHTSYLNHISNPFHALPASKGTQTPHMHLGQANAQLEIKSALFDRRISEIGGW